MKNNLFNILKWILLSAYLIVILGFSENKRNSLICKDFRITIEGEHKFINEEIVKDLLINNGIILDSCLIDNINFDNINRTVRAHPAVLTTQTYSDFSGTIYIRIKQRNPLLRVMTKDNNSFYIDTEGYKMPLSNHYTAHVPILSGSIKNTDFEKLKLNNYFSDLYNFIIFTQSHDLWKYQIAHIYITDNKEVELVPRLGNHIIYLGDLNNYEYKLKKLEALYETSLKNINWELYSGIDLRFSDQIILKKRQ